MYVWESEKGVSFTDNIFDKVFKHLDGLLFGYTMMMALLTVGSASTSGRFFSLADFEYVISQVAAFLPCRHLSLAVFSPFVNPVRNSSSTIFMARGKKYRSSPI